MALNKSVGNMYEFITHTFNVVKGKCYHDCSYCYMKRFNNQKPVRFDERELNTNLGSGNFIFVGSSCDMFAQDIPEEWIKRIFDYCEQFDNKYLFQTKNPKNIRRILPTNSNVCVTLESNRMFHSIMGKSPAPTERVKEMQLIRHPLYITIEPIMDFDLKYFIEMINKCYPLQVNIGADSQRSNLPEPSGDQIRMLIEGIKEFTKVNIKPNLKRLLK